ncbi:MAG TPA: TetR/AcrR family transcriptional regulator [Bacteroidales bacterium]|nr:TetR/AcrR family transcriptional regulator [Bacteroidales bacterium]
MDEIIVSISTLFMKYGIKSVSMDDVSRELGISKKTLYQYFKDKDELVTKVVEHHAELLSGEMFKMVSENANAIEQLLQVSKFVSQYLKNINPSVTYDLKKYYPQIWKNVNLNNRDYIFNQIKQNMINGIKEGLYRSDINIDIITHFYLFRMEMSQTYEMIVENKYSYEEIFNTSFNYHIRGIANKKGLEYLENKIKTQTKYN